MSNLYCTCFLLIKLLKIAKYWESIEEAAMFSPFFAFRVLKPSFLWLSFPPQKVIEKF